MPTALSVAVPDLVRALRTTARGNANQVAAVELLVADKQWLKRGDFRTYIDYDTHTHLSATPTARVDWERVSNDLGTRQIGGGGGELRYLGVAASLGGYSTGPLNELINGLGFMNLTLVLHAIAHVGRWPESGRQAVITGSFDTPPRRREPVTFQRGRRDAYKLLGDAADAVRGLASSPAEQNAVRALFAAVDDAKNALNQVAS